LHDLPAGFHHEAFGSQAAFRTALQALAYPGRIWPMDIAADAPPGAHAASSVLMLALLDADTTLWLSPSLAAAPVAAWLRFHTGCQLVGDVGQAHFVWVGAGDTVPALSALAQGSDADPQSSATLLLDVLDLEGGEPWLLSGPGVAGQQMLAARGLPEHLLAQWADNHAAFPRGIDLLLAAERALVGLPRTVRVSKAGRTQEAATAQATATQPAPTTELEH
jgi:alpha-D-ribose 1-methylphosphonate 5-triphosphate synthase subunit PhnH